MSTYYSQTARIAIYAQGEFGRGHSKTAEGVLRYGTNPVVAVIDHSQSGKTVADVMGIPSPVPVVGSLTEALKHRPQALLLGTAWTGGQLPDAWRPDIIEAIEAGLDIINGLHDFLADDPEYARLAALHNVRLVDVRRPPSTLPVGSGKAITIPAMTILTVGSDCSVGKMTTSLELTAYAQRAGHKAKFVATGQTGIMITGDGIAIDRVIGDFMAGAVEELVLQAGLNNDFVFVEGQGSLLHPGFSGVTLALLHGACPQAMILCHKSNKTTIDNLTFPILKLPQLVSIYEFMSTHLRPAKVVGIALNTVGMNDPDAQNAIKQAEAETGLPATDPVRFGVSNLFNAIEAYRESHFDQAIFRAT